jgi:hypothetical protein
LFTAPPTPAASPIPSSNTSPMLSAAAIVPNLEQSLEPSLLTHLF